MAIRDILGPRIKRGTIVLLLFIAMQGCDIAQERVYIQTETSRDNLSFDTRPSQTTLIDTLQQFAETHDTRCRQHIKRWEEWYCTGPNGT
jgi:hypothetical protein